MADKKYPGIKRLIAQDYHRNGVGGYGTVVTIFEPEPYEEGEDLGVFIAMTIAPEFVGDYVPDSYSVKRDGYRKASIEKRIRHFCAATYAVNIEKAAAGDVGFAEGNSWRAGDHWGPGIAAAWRDKCLASDFIPHDPFDDEDYLDQPDSAEYLAKRGSRTANLLHKIQHDDLDGLKDLRQTVEDKVAVVKAREAEVKAQLDAENLAALSTAE